MEAFRFLLLVICMILLSYATKQRINDSETRIIEAIEKQNDSINAVNFLNRENAFDKLISKDR
jgi:hypothetical protein